MHSGRAQAHMRARARNTRITLLTLLKGMDSMDTKQSQKPDLRAQMPMTAEWLGRQRAELGKAWVDQCVREGMKGVPGKFYSFEHGQVIGTPWPVDHQMHQDQLWAAIIGCTFAGFIAIPPKGENHGAH